MATITENLEGKESIASSVDAGTEVYQSVSHAAVASLVLGVLGLTAFPFSPMIALPVVGIIFAVIAYNAFKRFPEEYLGRPLALVGSLLCGVTLVVAPAWHTYVYLTEVPEGYTRLSFSDLLSEPNKAVAPTQIALDMNGEQVFIKGYIHPNSMDSLSGKAICVGA